MATFCSLVPPGTCPSPLACSVVKNSAQRTFSFAVFAVLALLASACGQTRGVSGNAATFELADGQVQEISNAQLSEIMTSIGSSQRFLDATSNGVLDESLKPRILTGLINEAVLDDILSELGVVVTDAEFDAQEADLMVQLGSLFVETPEATEEVRVELKPYLDSIVAVTAKQNAVGTALVAALPEPEATDVPCASHILVETLPEAEDLIAQLDDGGDFAALATEFSLDPGSGAAGGALGCTDPSQYVPEFADAISTGSEGELMGPIETQFGFHIIIITGTESVLAPQPTADELISNKMLVRLALLDPAIDPEIGFWDTAQYSVSPPVAAADQ